MDYMQFQKHLKKYKSKIGSLTGKLAQAKMRIDELEEELSLLKIENKFLESCTSTKPYSSIAWVEELAMQEEMKRSPYSDVDDPY